MLLLEKLAASPTDSLTYYAFAEDNYPAGAQTDRDRAALHRHPPVQARIQTGRIGATEWRGQASSRALEELIARQRFNLNRADRLAKHKPGDKIIAEDPLKIAGFEETLAGLTREFTEGVEGIVGQRIEPLHAAEEAMLGAIAALDHGQNAQAPAHMAVALRHLIEARDTLRILIGQDAAARPGDARLRPHANPEDPQAQERRGRGRGDRRATRSNWPRTKISSTRRLSWTTMAAMDRTSTEASRRRERQEGREKSRRKGNRDGTGKVRADGEKASRGRNRGEPKDDRKATERRRSPIRPASWKRS